MHCLCPRVQFPNTAENYNKAPVKKKKKKRCFSKKKEDIQCLRASEKHIQRITVLTAQHRKDS